ncbi:MAG: hypothetical protein QN194_14910 [Armatimonadota bacterium]|nr:hypothetical protein [Armatimonadota bacterium]
MAKTGYLDDLVAELGGDTADDPGALEVPADYVRELARIEALLERSGVSDLLSRRDELREKLKEMMGRERLERVVDEISGYEAVVVPSFTDVWDVAGLEERLTPEQRRAVLTVDRRAVEELIRSGALSRAQLEVDGVVTRRLRSVSLHVRPRRDGE